MERSLIDGWLCGGERGERGESEDRERGKARERARRCSYWFCGAPSTVQILPAGVLNDSATKSATALNDTSAPQFIRCDRCRSVVRVGNIQCIVKRNMYTLRLYAILHRNAEWPRPDTVTHTELTLF